MEVEMSYGWANSFFEIVCENAAQAEEINDILNVPKKHKFFTSWIHGNNDAILGLDLVDSRNFCFFVRLLNHSERFRALRIV